MDEYTIYIVKQKMYCFIALFLSFIFVIVAIIIFNKQTQNPKVSDSVSKYFYEQKILIKNQTKQLQNQIDSLNFRIEQNSFVLEKISKSKNQIKYVYINSIYLNVFIDLLCLIYYYNNIF